MGDPKKLKKKYETPNHPWEKDRIERDTELVNQYGLKNRKEVWKLETLMKKYKDIIKGLIPRQDEQAEKLRQITIQKLQNLGVISKDAIIDDILGMRIEHFLDRRLQTLVYKKGLARTMRQARQFITHRHIMVNGKVVTAPSYLVPLNEEATITFVERSPLNNPDHPERLKNEEKEGNSSQ